MCIGYILLARSENMLHQLELEFFIFINENLEYMSTMNMMIWHVSNYSKCFDTCVILQEEGLLS